MIEEYVHEQQGVWKTLLSLAHNMNKHFPPHHPPRLIVANSIQRMGKTHTLARLNFHNSGYILLIPPPALHMPQRDRRLLLNHACVRIKNAPIVNLASDNYST